MPASIAARMPGAGLGAAMTAIAVVALVAIALSALALVRQPAIPEVGAGAEQVSLSASTTHFRERPAVLAPQEVGYADTAPRVREGVGWPAAEQAEPKLYPASTLLRER